MHTIDDEVIRAKMRKLRVPLFRRRKQCHDIKREKGSDT